MMAVKWPRELRGRRERGRLLGDADLRADTVRYSAVFLTVLAFEESVKARILRAIAPAAAQGCSPGLSGASNRRRRQ